MLLSSQKEVYHWAVDNITSGVVKEHLKGIAKSESHTIWLPIYYL